MVHEDHCLCMREKRTSLLQDTEASGHLCRNSFRVVALRGAMPMSQVTFGMAQSRPPNLFYLHGGPSGW